MRDRLIVAISGSSAPQLGITLLQCLRQLGAVEVHLVVSRGAHRPIEVEAPMPLASVLALGDVVHDPTDLAAPISSGSFRTIGMVIIPCSMKTLGSIASGVTADLTSRAADVCLKERRRLVLVPRETPLNLIHLRNMVTVTEAGAVILPPMMAFYHAPKSTEGLLLHIAGKVLDQFGIEHDFFERWSGPT